MLNKHTKLTGLIVLMVVLFFTGVSSVWASPNAGVPFSIEPALPPNQDKDVKSYVSITTDSEEVIQTLGFVIENRLDKKQTIHIEAVNAYMTANGVVEYVSAANKNRNSSIILDPYQMQDYLTILSEKSIELAPKQRKIIPVQLTADKVDGTLLGGVSFYTILDNGEGSSTMQLENRLNQVIGVMVNFGTDSDVIFEIGDAFLEPLPSYFVVRLPITQNSPHLVTNATVDYHVEFQGEELFGAVKQIDSAPMTKANFAIPFESSSIEVKQPYRLIGTLTYTDTEGNEQVIPFDREFEFDGNMNPNDDGGSILPPIFDNGFAWWWLLLLLLPLLLLLLRKPKYVWQTDEEYRLVIMKDDANFEQIVKYKDRDKNSTARYMHIYIKQKVKNKVKNKEKKKENESYYFKYRKTKENKQTKSNESNKES